MNEPEVEKLLSKFKAAVEADLNEQNARDFLASLSISDYDQLIAVLENPDTKELPEPARLQLLKIFKAIRSAA